MDNLPLLIAIFVAVASLILLTAIVLAGSRKSVDARVADVKNSRPKMPRPSLADLEAQRGVVPRLGQVILPREQGSHNRLRSKLYQAGLYQRHSMAMFMGTKFVLMVAPVAAGVGLSILGMIDLPRGIALGTVLGLIGNLGPSLWLRHLKQARQKNIRRAMPDALDVIVICLEGGLSLSGALSRVSTELRQAHPLLAEEMAIVRREIQLGRSTGDALKQFADRFDAEELRSLASVVKQSERFGASIVKALRVHADTLRLKRYQHAETQAQKAPVKLIFPTVLCIFPALYIVLMGPAGVHLLELLDNLAEGG